MSITAADLMDDLVGAIGVNAKASSIVGWLDTHLPELNEAVSGDMKHGFPQGRMVEVFGPSSSGKCQPASTMVLGEHGLISIGEMFELNGFNPSCTSRDLEHQYRMINERGELETTSHFTWNNRKPLKRIIGHNGFITEATLRHPLRVMDEAGNIVWRHAGDIRIGDYLPVMRDTRHFGSGELTEDEARFIGYLVADGTMGCSDRFGFTNSDGQVSAWYCDFVNNKLGMKTALYTDNDRAPTYWTYKTADRLVLSEKYGLSMVKAAGKTVPLQVRTASESAQKAFIRAYFECECHIDQKACCIETTSASRKLLADVQLMLLNMGMVSRLSEKVVDGVSYYRLSLRGKNTVLYMDQIGFDTDARRLTAKGMECGRNGGTDIVPNILNDIRSLYQSVETTRRENEMFGRFVTGDQVIDFDSLGLMIDTLEIQSSKFNRHLFEKLRALRDGNLFFERVISIEDSEAPTFDICLPETHSFWANGFISHNTWIATLIMAAAQEQGGIAFFSDHERSFDPLFAEQFGLNLDATVFKHLKPRTFEDSMELFKKAVPMIRDKGFKKPIVWVFDSVAAMIPRSKLETDKGGIRENADFNMRDKLQLAVCCAQNYPILKLFAEDYNCAVVLLNQTRIDPSVMYGDGVTTPGGKAAEFYADVRVSLGRKDVKDKKGKLTGFEVKAKCIKNKIARPYREASWKIKLDDIMGIVVDSVSTNVEFAIRRGLIEVAGSYVVWEGKKVYASVLIERLEEDPEGAKKLLEMIYKSGEKAVEGS